MENTCRRRTLLSKLYNVRIIQSYIHFFLCGTIYRFPGTARGALKVLGKSLKTVFDEVPFIVNLFHQNLIKKYENDLEH